MTININLETPADFAANRQALAENTAAAVRATVAQETALMQRVRASVPRYANTNGYQVANAMTKARRALVERNRNGDEVMAWSYVPSDDEIISWLRAYAKQRDAEDAARKPRPRRPKCFVCHKVVAEGTLPYYWETYNGRERPHCSAGCQARTRARK